MLSTLVRVRESLARRICQRSVRSRSRRRGHPCRLEPILAENMKHGFALVQEIVRDDTSMTAPPYRFRTHDCAALRACQRPPRVEAGPERRAHRVIGIVMETGVVPKGVYGWGNALFPSAQAAERRQVIVCDVKFGKR